MLDTPPFIPGSDSAAQIPCPQCARKFVSTASMFQHQKAKHGITMPKDEIGKAAAFFDILIEARRHGKDWWVEGQYRQIHDQVALERKVAALNHALEMVRDADDDCKKDGGHPLPIPPIARAAIDDALAMAGK